MPVPGPWGPPLMMYPPCPPWAGWYGPWAPPLMRFHPGWSGHIEGFGYGGYYARDDRFVHVSHQQDSKISRQENWMVWNPKLDGLISQEAASAPGHRHEQYALKDGPSADQLENSQGRTRPRSESSTDGRAKPDMEKSPEEVAVEQNRVLVAKAEIRTGAGTSSWRPPNRTVWFPKPNSLFS
jgi:hypothetical protein